MGNGGGSSDCGGCLGCILMAFLAYWWFKIGAGALILIIYLIVRSCSG